jgi:hypothetical protein
MAYKKIKKLKTIKQNIIYSITRKIILIII